MKIINQSHEILNYTPSLEKTIEMAGRTCYKSESKITEDSAPNFIQKLIRIGHESVLEHGSITVKFITDRAVSHELVRHRLASYSQESQRYVGYHEEMEFIRQWWMSREQLSHQDYSYGEQIVHNFMLASAFGYQEMLQQGISPQKARAMLPNSVKTEIVVTANPREWRHIFRLRTSLKSYPQIRELMLPVRDNFAELWPGIFKDLKEG